METEARTTIDALFQLKGATREAKAYAFLYAAFKRTEIGPNPVRDALDCLVPFIAPYTNQIAGKQVTASGIQTYLKESFGFDIPLYAIDQLISALQQQGFVIYRKEVKAHFAVAHESKYDFVKHEIETEFDELTDELAIYAKSVGFVLDPPPSDSWGNALLSFLRARTDKAGPTIIKLKGALLDPSSAEQAVVGAFIRKLHSNEPDHFEKVVHIFMGTLIEDFISSVTEIGSLSIERPVTVFYDTAVLLRQLGCSGKSLFTATEELTRYLQDLGFRICYFSGNEAEVSGILDTIVYKKDTGKELEGETAIAIAEGEVTTTTLRMLQNAFPEYLARFNIFPAGKLETNALEAARYQIDEAGFSGYLVQQSRNVGRAYSQSNRINDAGYLASVMRLRRGNRARDLADCGYVFVTPNKFLASASRRYLIEQKVLGHNNFPPIISLGQIATIAWLLRDQTIPPEKAGRELLANCFAAVRPDAEWFKYFREGIESVVSDSLEDYSKQSTNALTIQAARRIAQDESFGSSVIVRQLNMAEILSRAEQEQQRVVQEQAARLDVERKKAEDEKAALLESTNRERADERELARVREQEAVEKAVAEARAEILAQIDEERRQQAHRWAHLSVSASKVLILLLLICIGIYTLILQNTHANVTMWILTGILAFASFLAYADLLKLHFMEPFFDGMHKRLTKIFGG